MKLIHKLVLGTVTAVLAAMPAAASTKTTLDLLQTVERGGINVVVNTPRCAEKPVLGLYTFRGMKRQLTLCPGSTIDPHDHRTVRHEVWHAIQHCVNTARGTDVRMPVNMDVNSFVKDVNTYLSEDRVSEIKRVYPKDHWPVELEAAMAEQLSNELLIEAFTKACIF